MKKKGSSGPVVDSPKKEDDKKKPTKDDKKKAKADAKAAKTDAKKKKDDKKPDDKKVGEKGNDDKKDEGFKVTKVNLSDEKVKVLQSVVDEKEAAVSQLRGQLDKAHELIEEQKSTIAEKDRLLKEKDKIIAEKDSIIKDLQAKTGGGSSVSTPKAKGAESASEVDPESERTSTTGSTVEKKDEKRDEKKEKTDEEHSAAETTDTPSEEDGDSGKKKSSTVRTKKTPKKDDKGSKFGSTGKGKKPGKGGKKDSKDQPRRTTSSESVGEKATSPRDKKEFSLTHGVLRSESYRTKGLFADILLDVQVERGVASKAVGGSIAAHSAILSVRCEKIQAQVKDLLAKRKKKVKNLDFKAFDMYSAHRMLDYLYYDDQLDLSKLTPLEILHLHITAVQYGLARLQWFCEDSLLKILDIDNVVPLLKEADQLKAATIKQFSLDFLLLPENFKNFVADQDAVNKLGLELFQQVVMMNATRAGSGAKAKELPACPDSTLRADFKRLYGTMELADAHVNLGGETVAFHKALLAAHSKKLLVALERSRDSADVTEVFQLKERQDYNYVGKDGFKAMLRFVYYGETSVDVVPACSLISWCHEYGLEDLKSVCEKKIHTGITNAFVLQIMAVTYLNIMSSRDEMKKLRKQCTEFVVDNLAEVDLKQVRSFESTGKSADGETKVDRGYALDLVLDLLFALQARAKQLLKAK